ncbi:helicase-related protein [Vibrio sp.]|uniref:helicase-related protein n=1 Tax=Vibrio sp. TaxID=678 RepID=UPI003D10A787
MHDLPIAALKQQVKTNLQRHHLVVEAETGSGKSTCLPLWAGEQGRVLVVEPRRIACTSLAQYLAAQSGLPLGKQIGYAIKLEQRFNEQTQVVFVTPGVALRWFADNRLADFDIVMVDEFHERRWDCDLLVALLHQAQSHRLIVTSATMEGARLSGYLNAKRLIAEGRNFAVSVQYLASESHHMPDSRGLERRVVAAVETALQQTSGDILVFLPGRKEIQQCGSALSHFDDILITPLHASVSDEERDRALNPQPLRKVVLATNVAETSLTIPNISAVVDSGLERRNIQRNGRTTLSLQAISKASAAQRAGRAGRVMDGICYRLYGQHAALETVTPPELQRESLTEAMLAAACSGFPLDQLSFLDPLHDKSLASAQSMLRDLAAIDDCGLATEHGRKIYPLPVDTLFADLISRMPSRALQEAMVDLAAALSVPARLYRLSANSDLLERLDQQEPLGCDAQLVIQLVRGNDFDGVSVDSDALREARGLSEQMREVFELPQLSVASRFDRSQLVSEIARLHPELLFVRREKRREALANGEMEMTLAREGRMKPDSEACLVLDSHSLPGRGVKQTLNLATVVVPVPLTLIEQLALGQWQQGETLFDGQIPLTEMQLVYAGRTIVRRQCQAEGERAIKPMLDAVLTEQVLPGLATKRRREIEHWKLYLELGLAESDADKELSFESWFTQLLMQLELQNLDELALFDEQDFPFDGIPDWQYDEFAERYPFELALGDLNLTVNYFASRKLVEVVYQSGLRRGEPKRWELPKWNGWRVQYRKASRVVQVR